MKPRITIAALALLAAVFVLSMSVIDMVIADPSETQKHLYYSE